MEKFKDNQGHEWTITLNLERLAAIRSSLAIDLGNYKHFGQLLQSNLDQLRTVSFIARANDTSLNLTADQFEERLYGGTVADDAVAALLREIDSFSQKLGNKMVAALARKAVQVTAAQQTQANDMIESGKLDSMLDEAIDQARVKAMKAISGE